MRILIPLAFALTATTALAETTDCELLKAEPSGFATLTLYRHNMSIQVVGHVTLPHAAALEATNEYGDVTPYLFNCEPDCIAKHVAYTYTLAASPSYEAPETVTLTSTNAMGEQIFQDEYTVQSCLERPQIRMD